MADRSLVQLPTGVGSTFEVYVNGVPQQAGELVRRVVPREGDHLVPARQPVQHAPTDEPGGAGEQDAHGRCPCRNIRHQCSNESNDQSSSRRFSRPSRCCSTRPRTPSGEKNSYSLAPGSSSTSRT